MNSVIQRTNHVFLSRLVRTLLVEGHPPSSSMAGRRGVTLIEILIVLAIVGLIAGGIAVYAVPKFQQAQKDSTKTSAMTLQTVAEAWRSTHANECPTAQLLKEQKEISSQSKITDAWDSPFKILCDEDQTTVVSYGPDKKEGTNDDIRIPEPTTPK